QAGDRPPPVIPIAKAAHFVAGDLFAVKRQALTASAIDNLRLRFALHSGTLLLLNSAQHPEEDFSVVHGSVEQTCAWSACGNRNVGCRVVARSSWRKRLCGGRVQILEVSRHIVVPRQLARIWRILSDDDTGE